MKNHIITLTCLNPLYIIRISCLVNLVCRHKSSKATGLACWNADGLFSCSSSSISVASSMIGLSGGVAIARWPPNRSPLLLMLLHAIVTTRTCGPTVPPGAPVVPIRHCPQRRERPEVLGGVGHRPIVLLLDPTPSGSTAKKNTF